MRLVGLTLLSAIAVSGCGPGDICNGVSGTCVSVSIKSSEVKSVDSLVVSASDAVTGTRTSSFGAAHNLPIDLAVSFPSSATAAGKLVLTVVGELHGNVVGQGSASVDIVANQHSHIVVTLDSGQVGQSTDMSSGDLGSAADAADLGPACAASCSDSQTLKTCDSQGNVQTQTCTLGCSSTSGAHCEQFYPSGEVTPSDVNLAGTQALNVSGQVNLFTDTGAIDNVRGPTTDATQVSVVNGVGYRQSNGVGIFDVDSLSVQSGATLILRGTLPVALVAKHGISVVGIIDARGYGSTGVLCDSGAAGPGGGVGGAPSVVQTDAGTTEPGANGASPSGNSGFGQMGATGLDGAGAGGGAYGDIGGKGGTTSSATSTPGVGGSIYGNATLIPLLGGSGGGSGPGNYGGGGGGAVQLVAGGSIVIGPGATGTTAGGVNAGGCGGTYNLGLYQAAAGAGGSGGAILVEAPTVQIIAQGVLAANGGTGAADGQQGGPATLGASYAPGYGGTGGVAGRTRGADGAAVTGTVGGQGGGGGAGRIRINTISGSIELDAAGVLSPRQTDVNSQSAAVTTSGPIDIH